MNHRTHLSLIAGYAESLIAFRGPLMAEFVDSGASVTVTAPAIDAAMRAHLQSLGAIPVSLPMQRTGVNPLHDIAYAARLYCLLQKQGTEVMLAYTIKPVIYGTLAAWFARVPRRYALITGLGYAFTGDRKGIIQRVVAFLYRLALARAHKVFFQNPDDERLFRQLGILPATVPSVVVNGSGVDVEAYAFHPVVNETPIFLMIGRLLGDKGVREYAAAARRVKASVPAARFQLAGWIDSNPDAIAQSELDGWIADGTLEFLGKLDDVRPAITAATVYVLPSYREGTPRTVLEAMAMGRPVITTDAPGCRETVTDGDNGFLVPVKSVNALVEAMLKFIEDPTLAPRMGQRSREIAEEKYDVHKVNAVMLREMGMTLPQGGKSHAS